MTEEEVETAFAALLVDIATDPNDVYGALSAIISYGQIDGDHHKTWVLDQAVRALAGHRYRELIDLANFGEDGPDTYSWDEGIAP